EIAMPSRSLAIVLSLLAGLGLFLAGPAGAADDANGWGTVKGQVVFGGAAIPEAKEIETVKNHQDKAQCLGQGPIYSEEWVINKNDKGVRWTFAWLEEDKG